MAGSDGFQVDLGELSTLANVDIPFIANTCSGAENSLKTDSWQDTSAMFDEATSLLYGDAETAFIETRADLENLMDALSGSLWQCSKALNEIHRRYAAADDEAAKRSNQIGATL